MPTFLLIFGPFVLGVASSLRLRVVPFILLAAVAAAATAAGDVYLTFPDKYFIVSQDTLFLFLALWTSLQLGYLVGTVGKDLWAARSRGSHFDVRSDHRVLGATDAIGAVDCIGVQSPAKKRSARKVRPRT